MESDLKIASEKAHQRGHFLALRSALSVPERLRQGRLICERLLELPELEGKKTLHTFWPLLDRGEVDLRPAIEAWIQRGGRVGLPVMASTTPPKMIQRKFLGDDRLVPARWGIMEPDVDCPEISLRETDAFVIPALAATASGERLGYGGGFYDAFLPSNATPVVVPLFEPCLTENIPTDTHDRKVNIVITPSKTIRTATSSPRKPYDLSI